jgi:hypothetical protein
MDTISRTAHTARRSLGAVSFALVLTFIVSLVPVSPLGSGVVGAVGLQTLSYSGASEWTASGPDDPIVPAKANSDLGAMHMTSTWAIADRTHFRVETNTSSPPLESQTSVYAADGGTAAIWYRDIDGVAIRMPLSKQGNPSTDLFLTGGALPLKGGSIGQYVAQYNHLGSGVHARLLGQQTYLGRTADVVEVRPVWSGTTSSCSTGAHGKQHCTEATHRYGREQIWVDHELLVILKVQVTGVPPQDGGNHIYRVTSFTFGQQPTAGQLAFTSPVPVTNPGTDSASSESSGVTLGGSIGWQAPPGFVSAGAPTGPDGHLYTSSGSSQTGEPGGQGIAGASVIFGRGRIHTHGITANFVLVQERKRENGPPPLFATGAIRTVGTCQAVTGTFPDGLHWLGFARKDIYVLVSSDTLTEENLKTYVSRALCK